MVERKDSVSSKLSYDLHMQAVYMHTNICNKIKIILLPIKNFSYIYLIVASCGGTHL